MCMKSEKALTLKCAVGFCLMNCRLYHLLLQQRPRLFNAGQPWKASEDKHTSMIKKKSKFVHLCITCTNDPTCCKNPRHKQVKSLAAEEPFGVCSGVFALHVTQIWQRFFVIAVVVSASVRFSPLWFFFVSSEASAHSLALSAPIVCNLPLEGKNSGGIRRRGGGRSGSGCFTFESCTTAAHKDNLGHRYQCRQSCGAQSLHSTDVRGGKCVWNTPLLLEFMYGTQLYHCDERSLILFFFYIRPEQKAHAEDFSFHLFQRCCYEFLHFESSARG